MGICNKVILCHNKVLVYYYNIIMHLMNIGAFTSCLKLLKQLFNYLVLFSSLNGYFNSIIECAKHKQILQFTLFMYTKLYDLLNAGNNFRSYTSYLQLIMIAVFYL